MNTASMLLPSALHCDSSQPSTPKTRFQSRMLFASPPLSPPPSSASSSSSSAPVLNNLFSTCRALQSMLQPSPIPSQLPSPPTQHAEPPAPLSLAPPPFKLRLRARGKEINNGTNPPTPRKKITKRTVTQAPRGPNKRRRDSVDEMSREILEQENNTPVLDSDDEWEEQEHNQKQMETQPSTPKRQRLAPEVLPLGLERGDFHSLHLQQQGGDDVLDTVEIESHEEWSTEEDRILVELVLEKLKLSKSDWQDCARSLGKDRGGVSKRWKSLMGNGDVGLRNRSRRTKLHGTWR